MANFRLLFATLLSVCILFPSTDVRSQEYNIGNGNLGASFMLVFPRGDFKKEMNDIGFGVNIDLGYTFQPMPLTVGIEGGYATYGSNTFQVPFSQFASVVTVEVETSNNMAFGHIFARFQPTQGIFRPYFEGLLGGTYFSTSSSVKNKATNEDIASSLNKNDITFSYGAGGGIAVKVWEGTSENDGHPFELLIDGRARFLTGGEATYYTKDAVYQDQGTLEVRFDEKKSKTSTTDIMTVHLGVLLRF